jgi:hypothetical protein
MESTTRKKVTTIALASLLGLALASGSAFAGKGAPRDEGNRSGWDNKKDGRGCPSEYTTDNYNYLYDLNFDGITCWKVTGDESNWVDNITNTSN